MPSSGKARATGQKKRQTTLTGRASNFQFGVFETVYSFRSGEKQSKTDIKVFHRKSGRNQEGQDVKMFIK